MSNRSLGFSIDNRSVKLEGSVLDQLNASLQASDAQLDGVVRGFFQEQWAELFGVSNAKSTNTGNSPGFRLCSVDAGTLQSYHRWVETDDMIVRIFAYIAENAGTFTPILSESSRMPTIFSQYIGELNAACADACRHIHVYGYTVIGRPKDVLKWTAQAEGFAQVKKNFGISIAKYALDIILNKRNTDPDDKFDTTDQLMREKMLELLDQINFDPTTWYDEAVDGLPGATQQQKPKYNFRKALEEQEDLFANPRKRKRDVQPESPDRTFADPPFLVIDPACAGSVDHVQLPTGGKSVILTQKSEQILALEKAGWEFTTVQAPHPYTNYRLSDAIYRGIRTPLSNMFPLYQELNVLEVMQIRVAADNARPYIVVNFEPEPIDPAEKTESMKEKIAERVARELDDDRSPFQIQRAYVANRGILDDSSIKQMIRQKRFDKRVDAVENPNVVQTVLDPSVANGVPYQGSGGRPYTQQTLSMFTPQEFHMFKMRACDHTVGNEDWEKYAIYVPPMFKFAHVKPAQFTINDLDLKRVSYQRQLVETFGVPIAAFESFSTGTSHATSGVHSKSDADVMLASEKAANVANRARQMEESVFYSIYKYVFAQLQTLGFLNAVVKLYELIKPMQRLLLTASMNQTAVMGLKKNIQDEIFKARSKNEKISSILVNDEQTINDALEIIEAEINSPIMQWMSHSQDGIRRFIGTLQTMIDVHKNKNPEDYIRLEWQSYFKAKSAPKVPASASDDIPEPDPKKLKIEL
jgi:hypothetical protein